MLSTSWRLALHLMGMTAAAATQSMSREFTSGANWAVIVAGSSGFWNYRHQADVCHAYHLVRRNGIPDENVILMSYNDAADSVDNPIRGTLYNKPTEEGVPGYDVNRGCKPTYSGHEVTGENFLAVLKGDNKTTEGKPVLRSTKEDRVFVYFADHGAVGLVAMPVGDPVYANDLINALRYMWTNDMYKELVFYMEACESGSMFAGLLPTNVNIYATTAANSEESSFGTYCGDDSSVDGVVIGSCLGDLYSVNFLENSDIPGIFHTESLDAQFVLLKNETDKSHVQKFGSARMGSDPIEWFQGAIDFPSLNSNFGEQAALVAALPAPKVGVESRDIKLHTLRHQRSRASRPHEQKKLDARIADELVSRELADSTFLAIKESFAHESRALAKPLSAARSKHSCLKAASTVVIASCGPWNDYSLKYVRVLAELCEAGNKVAEIAAAARRVCDRGSGHDKRPASQERPSGFEISAGTIMQG